MGSKFAHVIQTGKILPQVDSDDPVSTLPLHYDPEQLLKELLKEVYLKYYRYIKKRILRMFM